MAQRFTHLLLASTFNFVLQCEGPERCRYVATFRLELALKRKFSEKLPDFFFSSSNSLVV